MDIFKKNLAPMPNSAWEEINERAEDVINSMLTTRKSLKVNGPFGLDKTMVASGRLNLVKNSIKENVKIGLYDIKPLLETRINFELSRWELDNILRGAKDIDLENLEKAAHELALFEEEVIYNGLKEANIKGLVNEAGHRMSLNNDSQDILDKISDAVFTLKKSYVSGPFNLIVSKDLYKALNKIHGAKILRDLVKSIIGGNVYLSEVINGGLLLPLNHDDIEFTIGQEYTVGYENHNEKDIKLFIMNSFTLRVLDPNILVYYSF
jgi:uncharacterized linocin/CFP29 family protein